MLECAMFRSYCRSWWFLFFFLTPFMKENERFIRRAIFNTRLKLKTGHARDTNKTTGNARLSRSAEWNYSVEKQTRLINNDGCVQESQLVGLNHYLSGAHLTFSFCFFKKKKPQSLWVIRNSVAARHALPWGAVLKYNFIRINHNLHDFSVIHSHLKLNFIDAWREPSLRVVHCQWTSWAGGGGGGGGGWWRRGWGGGYTSEWWLFFFSLEDCGINDRKTLLGMWHSASCVCVLKEQHERKS